jgi:hypothetical protein
MGGEQCPYDLVWSEVAKKCGTPCPPPYYSDAENTTSYIVGMILGWTGFLGCYFYCMTALFRCVSHSTCTNRPNMNVQAHYDQISKQYSIFLALFGCHTRVWAPVFAVISRRN